MKVFPHIVNLTRFCCWLFFYRLSQSDSSASSSPLIRSAGRPTVVSLYNASSDFVVSLDYHNLDWIYGRDQAVLLEFYSSWCGHCIQFSPVYKALAEATRFWRPCVVVAAINCADAQNFPECRRYGLRGYPTLRLFPARAPPAHLGLEIDVHPPGGVAALAGKIADFVAMHVGADRPDTWPDSPEALPDSVGTNITESLAIIESFLSAVAAAPENADEGVGINGSLVVDNRVGGVSIVFENSSFYTDSFFAKTVALDLSQLWTSRTPIKVFSVGVDDGNENTATNNISNINTSLSSLFHVEALPAIVFLSSLDLDIAEKVPLARWEAKRDSLVRVVDFDIPVLDSDYDDLNNNNSKNNNGSINNTDIEVDSSSPDDGGCWAYIISFVCLILHLIPQPFCPS